MATLVGNGSKLYRRANSLVRTPIYDTITLLPDDRAWYAIAGDYYNDWPNGGFRYPGYTYNANAYACYDLLDAFFDGYGTQIWRHVDSGGLDPRNIYYAGRYSTHNPTPDYSECYEQICAYHFTLPKELRDSEIVGVRWKVQHSGEIICYRSAYAKSKNNFFTQDWAEHGFTEVRDQGWDSPYWMQGVGLFQRLNDNLAQMYNQTTDDVNLETGLKSGSPNGWEMIWTARTTDGCIPLCSIPYYRTYQLSETIKNAFDINKGGWIVSIPHHERISNDEPLYISEEMFYWLCSSFKTEALEVDVLVHK